MGKITRFPFGIGCGKATYGGGVLYDGGLPVVADMGSPIALDADSFIVAATGTELPNATSITYTTANIGTSPCDGVNNTWILGVPRNMKLTVTHSTSVVAMDCLVAGYDVYDEAMSELLSVTAGGTSKTATGKKAFKKITSITFTSTGNAQSNTANLGHDDTLGLPYLMAHDTIMKVTKAGAAVTLGTITLADTTSPATTTTGDVRGTYLPAAACDGSQYRIIYIPTSLTSRGVTQA
jgi:hypothetical protein